MSVDPTAAYRKQQGIAPVTQSYDPELVNMIVRASDATGADPAALLATALQESGARLHPSAGDGGTSFGPFQFHIGGALGSHSPAWASTYAAVLNRAHEFARLKVHGGVGAAAVQRPADSRLYAKGVGNYLEQARAILGKTAPFPKGKTPDTTPPAPSLSTSNPILDRATLIAAINSDASTSDLIGLMQQADEPGVPAPAAKAVSSPAQGTPKSQAVPGGHGKVVNTGKPHYIGLPYQGTHTLYGNWESDNAVDIALPGGTPVYAVADGTIGSQIGPIGGSDPHMAGERLHLNIAGNELYYQHLKTITVKAGQRVKKGQLLGYTGALNHLHLGVKNGKPQAYA